MKPAPPSEAAPAWSAEEFEARLRAKEDRYHIHHPFNRRLNSGELQPFQVRGWVANRFYYQASIPIKDAAILSNCRDREVRRRWIERLLDHDGRGDHEGGERWRHRGLDAAGHGGGAVARGVVVVQARGAGSAICRRRLREFRAAARHGRRQQWDRSPKCSRRRSMPIAWPAGRPSIHGSMPAGLAYFRSRIPLATRDVEHGLEVARRLVQHTRGRQERAIAILQFKLDILWSMLDTIDHAYPDDLPMESRP